jgi:hypothetical protein
MSAAWRIVSQSERLPMMSPTSGAVSAMLYAPLRSRSAVLNQRAPRRQCAATLRGLLTVFR